MVRREQVKISLTITLDNILERTCGYFHIENLDLCDQWLVNIQELTEFTSLKVMEKLEGLEVEIDHGIQKSLF